ncbi:unnamed protein product [Clonostachys byssicola]|uniref:5'-3' DNA helicase ZGRF1-like N-terminal domain-containing protein n=1 Tax=Clonostachys byssicola TaxID=160290 RepID=A0A9N9USL8_9HYPO|nr:unnamed protein product [Clonostachys byssicola]
MASSLQTRVAQRPHARQATTTAPVHEFICLFTHDLKRKNQKRWQDGKLKFHTYNKRIVVHDNKGNHIGDSHWPGNQEDMVDGEEFTLDRGSALVQVCEQVGTTEHDLGELVDKRVKEVEARRMRIAAHPSSASRPDQTPRPTDNIQFQRPLSAIMHTPNRIGRSVLPRQSPYEVRQSEQQEQGQGATERPAKRRKRSVSPPAKSGHARGLFGGQLCFSNPSASTSAARIRALRDQATIRREQQKERLVSSVEKQPSPENIVQEDHQEDEEELGQVSADTSDAHVRKLGSPESERATATKQARLRLKSLDIKAKRKVENTDATWGVPHMATNVIPWDPEPCQESMPPRKKPRPIEATEPSETEEKEPPKTSVLQNRAPNRLGPTGLSRATPSLHSITKRVEEQEDEVVCLEARPKATKPTKSATKSTKKIQPTVKPGDEAPKPDQLKTRKRSPTVETQNFPIAVDDESEPIPDKPQPRTALRIKPKRKRGLMMLAEKKIVAKPVERSPSPPPPKDTKDLPTEDSFEQWLGEELPLDDSESNFATEYGNECTEIEKPLEGKETDGTQKSPRVDTAVSSEQEGKQSTPEPDRAEETANIPTTEDVIQPAEVDDQDSEHAIAHAEEEEPNPQIDATSDPGPETASHAAQVEHQEAQDSAHCSSGESDAPQPRRVRREKQPRAERVPTESPPKESPPKEMPQSSPEWNNDDSEESNAPQLRRTRKEKKPRAKRTPKESPQMPQSSPERNNDDSEESDDWQGPAPTTKQQVRTRAAPARSKKQNQAKSTGPQITRMSRKSIKSKEIIGFKLPSENKSIPSAYVSAVGRIGLQEDVPSATLHRSLSLEGESPPIEQQPIKRHEQPRLVRQQSDPQPKGRLVNPATRGKKAASKADAAGQILQTLVPFDPVTRPIEAPMMVRERKKVAAPEAAPSRESRGPAQTLPGQTLPGFSKANGGAWSRHAEDLLGMTRPNTSGPSRI